MLAKLRVLTGTTAITLLALSSLVGCSNAPQAGLATTSEHAFIIGGKEAKGDEDFATTLVGLYNIREGFMCTGSIVSNELILTAAHCVVGDAGDTLVVFGKNAVALLEASFAVTKDAKGNPPPSVDEYFKRLPLPTAIRRGTAYRVSPVWTARQNESLNTGDIALLKFEGGLLEGYVAAELLSDATKLEDGQTVLLSGYGVSDQTKGEGSGLLRFVETTIQTAKYTLSEILIDQTKGKGACHGDSGGPAYVVIEKKKYVVGVTSRGVNDPEDTCAVNAAFTSVPFYSPWLARAAKEMTKPAKEEPQKPAPEAAPAAVVAQAG